MSERAAVARRYGLSLAGLLAVGVLTLSACGSSNDSGSGTPAAKAPANATKAPANDAATKGGDTGNKAPKAADANDGKLTGSTFSKEPCDVLSADEVSQALGTKVAAKAATSMTGLKQCLWTAPGNTSGIPDLQLHYNSTALAKAFAVGLQQNMLTDKEKKLDIGDGAVLEKGQGDIYVLVGASEFEINGSLSKPVSDDVVSKLATVAASRLK